MHVATNDELRKAAMEAERNVDMMNVAALNLIAQLPLDDEVPDRFDATKHEQPKTLCESRARGAGS